MKRLIEFICNTTLYLLSIYLFVSIINLFLASHWILGIFAIIGMLRGSIFVPCLVISGTDLYFNHSFELSIISAIALILFYRDKLDIADIITVIRIKSKLIIRDCIDLIISQRIIKLRDYKRKRSKKKI